MLVAADSITQPDWRSLPFDILVQICELLFTSLYDDPSSLFNFSCCCVAWHNSAMLTLKLILLRSHPSSSLSSSCFSSASQPKPSLQLHFREEKFPKISENIKNLRSVVDESPLWKNSRERREHEIKDAEEKTKKVARQEMEGISEEALWSSVLHSCIRARYQCDRVVLIDRHSPMWSAHLEGDRVLAECIRVAYGCYPKWWEFRKAKLKQLWRKSGSTVESREARGQEAGLERAREYHGDMSQENNGKQPQVCVIEEEWRDSGSPVSIDWWFDPSEEEDWCARLRSSF